MSQLVYARGNGQYSLPPPPITSAGISSRPEDVQVYEGLTPHGLSEAQIDELFEAIAAMRKAAKATEFVKHGWTLQWKVRQNQGGSTRGDMCIIDPRDVILRFLRHGVVTMPARGAMDVRDAIIIVIVLNDLSKRDRGRAGQ